MFETESPIQALERHILEDQPTNKENLYSKEFFQSLLKYRPAYHYIADIITSYFKPKKLIDWGCGCGFILEKLKMNGIQEVCGIEGSSEVQEFIPESLKGDINIVDALLVDWAEDYDMAISIEVAEHVDEKDSGRFVNNICNSANDWVWFSAAQIGQTGTGHVNLKSVCEWISIFKEINLFEIDWEITYKIKQELLKNQQIAMGFPWLRDNCLIFRRI